MTTTIKHLKRVSLFANLTDDQVQQVAAIGEIKSHAAGTVVLYENDPAESMYVIFDGRARVIKHDEDGTEVEIARLEAGDFFGELALLDDGKRSATVTCATDCTLFVLTRTDFLDLLSRSDTMMIYGFMKAMTQRVRSSSQRVFSEELARQQLEAETQIERLKSLTQMVAGVAHELNTPLGIINTASTLIDNRLQHSAYQSLLDQADRRTRSLAEDIAEAADLIQSNIARAHRLVENFKKISVNQLTEDLETIHLPDLLQTILELYKINARQSNLKIIVQQDLDAQEAIWTGYSGALTQIVLNLLTNIDRYAYPDATGGDVTITLFADGESYVLRVADAGAGIPADHLQRVFDPFFTTGRGRGGTGLGMSIVYNLVTTRLQGTIEIESELNQGTTVTVSFPQVITVADQ